MNSTNLILLCLIPPVILFGQSVDECMDCHSDEEFTKFIDDTTEISLYIDLERFENSLHGGLECVDCHSDIEDADHEPELAAVDCEICHEEAAEAYLRLRLKGLPLGSKEP